MRPPLKGLSQGNDRAGCETFCALQLLYMYGVIEQNGIQRYGIDRKTGRKKNQPDVDCGIIRLLLDEGFYLYSITDWDPRRVTGAGGLQYVRRYMADKGMDLDEAENFPEKHYEVMRHYLMTSEKLMRRSNGRFTERIKRPATERDLRQQLDLGRVVQFATTVSTVSSHAFLAIPTQGSGGCLVFDPADGSVSSSSTADVADRAAGNIDVFWR